MTEFTPEEKRFIINAMGVAFASGVKGTMDEVAKMASLALSIREKLDPANPKDVDQAQLKDE